MIFLLLGYEVVDAPFPLSTTQETLCYTKSL